MPELTSDEFKALRHRFYRVGKSRRNILWSMGYLTDVPEERINQDIEREVIWTILRDGRIEELIQKIEQEETNVAVEQKEIG
jgi:hypothetical protein